MYGFLGRPNTLEPICTGFELARTYGARVWLVMGYESWAKWCDSELDGFKLPAVERREVVAELAGYGMSNRSIAEVIGTSEFTVRNDKSGAINNAPDRKNLTMEVGGGFVGPLDPIPVTDRVVIDVGTGEEISRQPIPDKVLGRDGKSYSKRKPKPPRPRPISPNQRPGATRLSLAIQKI